MCEARSLGIANTGTQEAGHRMCAFRQASGTTWRLFATAGVRSKSNLRRRLNKKMARLFLKPEGLCSPKINILREHFGLPIGAAFGIPVYGLDISHATCG